MNSYQTISNLESLIIFEKVMMNNPKNKIYRSHKDNIEALKNGINAVQAIEHITFGEFPDFKEALEKWETKYKKGEGFIAITGTFFKYNEPIILFFRMRDEQPWSVQFCGNGHYFETFEESFAYMLNRIQGKR